MAGGSADGAFGSPVARRLGGEAASERVPGVVVGVVSKPPRVAFDEVGDGPI